MRQIVLAPVAGYIDFDRGSLPALAEEHCARSSSPLIFSPVQRDLPLTLNFKIQKKNQIKKIKEILFKINNGEIKEIQKNARKYILNSHDIFLIMNREAKFLK